MASSSVVIFNGIVKPGDIYGILDVIGWPFRTTWNGRYLYRCVVRCLSCGKVFVGYLGLMTRRGKGCKCINVGARKHGKTSTPLYRVWSSMRNRCADKSNPHYGGKGISVCQEWDDFEVFEKWALANGWYFDKNKRRNQIEIDRFPDRNGNYEPGNCRIATKTQNNRNTNRNRMIEAFGESKCLSEWAEDPRCVVSVNMLWERLFEYEWTPEKALSEPKKNGRGENSSQAKLTEAAVRNILLNKDGKTHRKIAELHGVSKAAIRDIMVGRNWKHLPRPQAPPPAQQPPPKAEQPPPPKE